MKLFSLGTEGLNDCASTLSPLCWRGAESTCPLLRQIPPSGPKGRPGFLTTTCSSVRGPHLRLCALPKTLRTLRPPPGRFARRNAPPSPSAAGSPSAGNAAQLWVSDFSSASSPHAGAPSWLRERASRPAVGIVAAALQTTTLQCPYGAHSTAGRLWPPLP